MGDRAIEAVFRAMDFRDFLPEVFGLASPGSLPLPVTVLRDLRFVGEASDFLLWKTAADFRAGDEPSAAPGSAIDFRGGVVVDIDLRPPSVLPFGDVGTLIDSVLPIFKP